MHSSVIGKIEKGHRYAMEPDRISVERLGVRFRGDNDTYDVALEGGAWRCSCHSFHSLHGCAHILALQSILDAMLADAAKGSALFPEAIAVA